MKRDRNVTVLQVRPADDVWGVASLRNKHNNEPAFQKRPCKECPWRKDVSTGRFPAEAYRLSANTSYDSALETFACHMSGRDQPTTCAGFLLQNAENNIGVRIAYATERYDPSQVSSDVPLYDSYKAMAVANGIDEDDPALARCRANWE